jgi:thioredoxin reductase (NADPH)
MPEIFFGGLGDVEKKEESSAPGSLNYDVVIIGGGPSGLTAGMYTARAKLKTLIIEKMALGGQIIITEWVENYPGFEEGISGYDLGRRFENHARKYGAEIVMDEVLSVAEDGDDKLVKTTEKTYRCKVLLIATGASPHKLGVPGEAELTGRGVSYCGTCDAAFFKDKEVVVIGGGDTAVQEAIFLSKFASKVTIIHRRDRLRAIQIMQDQAKANPKISFIWNAVVEKINGTKSVESVTIKDLKTGAVSDFRTDGCFIFVGIDPQTQFLQGQLEQDEQGYIIVDQEGRTSKEGIFACGDCVSQLLRQIATAVGRGAATAYAAQQYLEQKEMASSRK